MEKENVLTVLCVTFWIAQGFFVNFFVVSSPREEEQLFRHLRGECSLVGRVSTG